MKKIVHQSLSILLVMMVLSSTMTWTISQHYCMGRIVDTTFFKIADDCGMAAGLELMGFSQKDNPCCDDKTVVFEAETDWDFYKDIIQLPFVFESSRYIKLEAHLPITPLRPPLRYWANPPPNSDLSLHLLYSQFLI